MPARAQSFPDALLEIDLSAVLPKWFYRLWTHYQLDESPPTPATLRDTLSRKLLDRELSALLG